MNNPNPPAGLGSAIQQPSGPGTSPGQIRPAKEGDPANPPLEAKPLTLADLPSLSFKVAEAQKIQGSRGFSHITLERQDSLDQRLFHRTTVTTTDPALTILDAGQTLIIQGSEINWKPTAGTNVEATSEASPGKP